jgi:hypothetical protein
MEGEKEEYKSQSGKHGEKFAAKLQQKRGTTKQLW